MKKKIGFWLIQKGMGIYGVADFWELMLKQFPLSYLKELQGEIDYEIEMLEFRSGKEVLKGKGEK